MSVRNLEYLFRPRSIAVIGGTDRPRSVRVAGRDAYPDTFGPVVLFGQGGVAVEIVGDRSSRFPCRVSARRRAIKRKWPASVRLAPGSAVSTVPITPAGGVMQPVRRGHAGFGHGLI